MKKLLLYFTILTGAICALSGCKKEEKTSEQQPPVITVREPKVYPSEAATHTLYYEVENPREGVELELTSTESWISELGADKRKISFTLLMNTTITTRKGNITFSYEGAESVTVEIAQSGADQSVTSSRTRKR